MPPHTTGSHDDSDDPDDAQDTADERARPIVEFNVPADAFMLATTLAEVPETIVEFEQFIPTRAAPLPYLWATDGDHGAFEEAAATDPTVERATRIATLEQGALYEMEWTDIEENDGVLGWLRGTDATMLQSEGQDDEWQLKLRVESHDVLRDLQAYCRERDIDFDLIRLYDMTEPKMGQYNITEKQREIMIAATEMGYFEIPRGATLGEVAESIGISTKAASERLRRGQANLVNNTLTIGRPTGIGIN